MKAARLRAEADEPRWRHASTSGGGLRNRGARVFIRGDEIGVDFAEARRSIASGIGRWGGHDRRAPAGGAAFHGQGMWEMASLGPTTG